MHRTLTYIVWERETKKKSEINLTSNIGYWIFQINQSSIKQVACLIEIYWIYGINNMLIKTNDFSKKAYYSSLNIILHDAFAIAKWVCFCQKWIGT